MSPKSYLTSYCPSSGNRGGCVLYAFYVQCSTFPLVNRHVVSSKTSESWLKADINNFYEHQTWLKLQAVRSESNQTPQNAVTAKLGLSYPPDSLYTRKPAAKEDLKYDS
ncbi:hypothetical protein ILYODFUR_024263 [Ilyodon furcidens]|uniref:Uncharacterized protein n=1 Tax=Ilyodon furcidens TaxID=33524 RepID=A0ABV0U9R9_9TELE